MKTSKIIIIGAAIVLAVPIIWLIRNSRMTIKTPCYKVVRADGAVEVRDYPGLTLAATTLKDGGMNESFGHLFGFITGKNAKSEKIPMTTPVLIESAHGQRTMNFIMSTPVTEKGIPEPINDQVHLETSNAGRFAAMRFSGGSGDADGAAAVEKLRAWMSEQKITAEGEPVFAYYDPPWTPRFLRRNEVMIRVSPDAR